MLYGLPGFFGLDLEVQVLVELGLAEQAASVEGLSEGDVGVVDWGGGRESG